MANEKSESTVGVYLVKNEDGVEETRLLTDEEATEYEDENIRPWEAQ